MRCCLDMGLVKTPRSRNDLASITVDEVLMYSRSFMLLPFPMCNPNWIECHHQGMNFVNVKTCQSLMKCSLGHMVSEKSLSAEDEQ